MSTKLKNLNEPQMEKLLNAVGKSIEITFEFADIEKPMFVAIVFDDPGMAQYVSNCQREDMIKALRECADRLERKQDIPR